MKKIEHKIREKGSITLIVLATVMFIMAILGTYLSVIVQDRKSQLLETKQLQEVWSKNEANDTDLFGKIYDLGFSVKNTTDITPSLSVKTKSNSAAISLYKVSKKNTSGSYEISEDYSIRANNDSIVAVQFCFTKKPTVDSCVFGSFSNEYKFGLVVTSGMGIKVACDFPLTEIPMTNLKIQTNSGVTVGQPLKVGAVYIAVLGKDSTGNHSFGIIEIDSTKQLNPIETNISSENGFSLTYLDTLFGTTPHNPEGNTGNSYPMYLFGNPSVNIENVSGPTNNISANLKIYGMVCGTNGLFNTSEGHRIYACRRKSDSIVGFYDIVTGKFFSTSQVNDFELV